MVSSEVCPVLCKGSLFHVGEVCRVQGFRDIEFVVGVGCLSVFKATTV